MSVAELRSRREIFDRVHNRYISEIAHDRSRAPAANPRLTERQLNVLACLVRGESNKQIARSLNLAEGTIKVHLAAIFMHLGVTSRTAAAVAGARLVNPDGSLSGRE